MKREGVRVCVLAFVGTNLLGVMLGGHFFRRPDHLQAHQLVAALFKTSNDIANDSTLDAIGLDGQKGAFLVGSGLAVDWQGFFATNQGKRASSDSESGSSNGSKTERGSSRSGGNSLLESRAKVR